MAASNTRFTQNSLGQSKNLIDSDHGIYRDRANHAAKFPLFGCEAADDQGARLKKTVQIGGCLRFLGSNSEYSARSKTGTGQHVEDDDEVRVDPENH